MTDITYPPEMLPVADPDDDVAVIVCHGPPRCTRDGEGPCPLCMRFDNEDR